jgi:Helix-turn-helix domain/PASTA domain
MLSRGMPPLIRLTRYEKPHYCKRPSFGVVSQPSRDRDVGELGLSLSQARLARGLSLEDAERSTLISRRFLRALETQDYSVFPAPVYARGLLRTYSRFLGLDPEQQVRELPIAWNETPRLAAVTRRLEGLPTDSSRLQAIAAGVCLLLVVVAYALNSGGFRARDEGPDSHGATLPSAASAVSGKQIAQTPAGILPDFTGASLNDALSFLALRRLSYLVIESSVDSVPEGLVAGQSPTTGSRTQAGDVITLTVSKQAAATAPLRTDCSSLAAATVRTSVEQQWLLTTCGPTPGSVPDRTNCDQIRGTEYRSAREREFFLASCVTG